MQMSKIGLYIAVSLGVIWLLAVVKVFLSDGTTNNVLLHQKSISSSGQRSVKQRKAPKTRVFRKATNVQPLLGSAQSVNNVVVPKASEWIFIRSSTKYKIEDSLKPAEVPSRSVAVAAGAHQPLSWPPVLMDGTISKDDGVDILPILKIEVPKFWSPPEGTDLNTAGSHVNGEETIFLMIASYRDFQCRDTIASAFNRATHPERLFVGAVDQTVPGDIGCLDVATPCSVEPHQPLCKYRNQISVYHMDAKDATGPVTARHVGDRMYRGEYYVMQMDAHCLFINDWDTKIIAQWRMTNNEMAVLSSYLSDVQGSITPTFESTRNTRPIMCQSDFEGQMPARYLRHGQQPEDVPEIKDMPQLQPFWAAGFSFSRGHFKVRVPYDAYQPMVFQGEEIEIGIRGFTYGYDFYAPRDSVVFHEYASRSNRRKAVPFFTEQQAHKGEGQKSLRRATSIIHMAPDIDPSTWDHSELDKYGLGTVRDISLFYKLFLIDVNNRKAVPLCPFVKTGIMHTAFQPKLRSDRLGIDYTDLVNYDTKASIDAQLLKQHPYWEKRIRDLVQQRDKAQLQDAIASADRIGLTEKQPALIQAARDVINGVPPAVSV